MQERETLSTRLGDHDKPYRVDIFLDIYVKLLPAIHDINYGVIPSSHLSLSLIHEIKIAREMKSSQTAASLPIACHDHYEILLSLHTYVYMCLLLPLWYLRAQINLFIALLDPIFHQVKTWKKESLIEKGLLKNCVKERTYPAKWEFESRNLTIASKRPA